MSLSNAKYQAIRRNCVCGANQATFDALWARLPEELLSLPALTIAKILNAMQERYQAGRASCGELEICDDCLWVPEKYTNPEYGGLLVPLAVLKNLKLETGIKEHEFDRVCTECTYKNGKESRNEVIKHYKGSYAYSRYSIDYTEWGRELEEGC